MKEQRIDWLDLIKGIGLILVIIGHSFRDEMRAVSSVADFIYSLIYIFNMPLFFAIAGYLYSVNYEKYIKRNCIDYFTKRVKGYIRPFIAYSLLIYVMFYVVNHISFVKTILDHTSLRIIPFKDYVLLGLEGNNPYAFHVWYLLVLFLISVFAFMLSKVANRIGLKKGLIILTISFILWNFRIFLTSDTVMILKMVLKFPIFFSIGMYYKDIKRGKLYLPISVLCWGYVILYLCGLFNETTGVLWYIKNLLLLVSTICILDNLFVTSEKIGGIRPINYLGKNSLCFYLFHQPFCCGLLGTLLYINLGYSILMTCLVCIFASIAFPFLILCIKNKVKPIGRGLSLLFGI